MLHVRAGQAIGAGRLDEAWDWLQRADEDCRWLGRPRLLMTDNGLTHVLLHALRGEADACREHGQQAVPGHAAQQRAQPPPRAPVGRARRARRAPPGCWATTTALRELDRLLREAAHPSEWASAPRCRDWSRAFVALLDGRLDDARVLLEPMATDIERYRYFAGAQARFMLADIHARQGALDAAAATLRPWLEQARQSGEIGGALFAGPPVLQRLAGADWGGRLTPTERGQLDSFAALLAPLPAGRAGDAPVRRQPTRRAMPAAPANHAARAALAPS